MRFHITAEFSQAKSAAEAAHAEFERQFDIDDSSAETTAASALSCAALENMLAAPAVTPTELRLKLEQVFSREVTGWGCWERIQPALLDDLRRMQAQAVSPAIAIVLAKWRETNEAFQLDPDGDDRCEINSQAYRDLMAEPCTTAGDFIAKAYVNMLGEHGSTLYGEAKADLTGNMFDIDIAKADDEIEQGEIWARAAYADFDASDLGANLLAYGLPHFSAEHWMERADAIGMRVSLLVQEDGRRCFYTSLVFEDENVPERVRRERDRLQRIQVFDPSRAAALADEIEREWPQLILRAVPIPVTQVSEKAA